MKRFTKHAGNQYLEDGKSVPTKEEEVLKLVDDGEAEIINFMDTDEAKDKACLSKRNEINAKRDMLIDANIEFLGTVFDCNVKSRSLVGNKVIGNMIRTARSESFTTSWIDLKDNIITMTSTELEDLGLAMESQLERTLFVANTHKKALAAKKLVSTIEAYDYSVGW